MGGYANLPLTIACFAAWRRWGLGRCRTGCASAERCDVRTEPNWRVVAVRNRIWRRWPLPGRTACSSSWKQARPCWSSRPGSPARKWCRRVGRSAPGKCCRLHTTNQKQPKIPWWIVSDAERLFYTWKRIRVLSGSSTKCLKNKISKTLRHL